MPLPSNDIAAALSSLTIIETCNRYFHGRWRRERDRNAPIAQEDRTNAQFFGRGLRACEQSPENPLNSQARMCALHTARSSLRMFTRPVRGREPGKPVRTDRRSHRGLTPARRDDVELIAAVMRGEHSIPGFRNGNIRDHLFGTTQDPLDRKRQSRKVGRLLKLLHAHKLIAKIPRSRRRRVTKDGNTTMTTILGHHYDKSPQTHAAQAARQSQNMRANGAHDSMKDSTRRPGLRPVAMAALRQRFRWFF